MNAVHDIFYNEDHGERGTGDLYLPDEIKANTSLVLCIHGGGWTGMDKSRMTGIGTFLADNGFAVFACNYRLAGTAPWPACGDDCLEAAAFLLKKKIPELAKIKCGKIGIIGGSAGGHLALMTGLRFPQTKWIVDISGIADPMPFFKQKERADYFFGHRGSDDEFEAAFPLSLLKQKTIPPILCTHMNGDQVVPIESMKNFVKAAEQNGVPIRQYVYEPQPGFTGHGIWRPELKEPVLLKELENVILDFIHSTDF